eukprot:1142496-Pelagomonas_calceolata.AAC.5
MATASASGAACYISQLAGICLVIYVCCILQGPEKLKSMPLCCPALNLTCTGIYENDGGIGGRAGGKVDMLCCCCFLCIDVADEESDDEEEYEETEHGAKRRRVGEQVWGREGSSLFFCVASSSSAGNGLHCRALVNWNLLLKGSLRFGHPIVGLANFALSCQCCCVPCLCMCICRPTQTSVMATQTMAVQTIATETMAVHVHMQAHADISHVYTGTVHGSVHVHEQLRIHRPGTCLCACRPTQTSAMATQTMAVQTVATETMAVHVHVQAHADISYGYTDPAQLHHGTAAYQGWGVGSVSSGDAGAAGCPTMGDGSGYLSVGGNDSSGGSAAVGDGSGYLVPLPSWQQQQQQAPALLPPASGGFALPPWCCRSGSSAFPQGFGKVLPQGFGAVCCLSRGLVSGAAGVAAPPS